MIHWVIPIITMYNLYKLDIQHMLIIYLEYCGIFIYRAIYLPCPMIDTVTPPNKNPSFELSNGLMAARLVVPKTFSSLATPCRPQKRCNLNRLEFKDKDEISTSEIQTTRWISGRAVQRQIERPQLCQFPQFPPTPSANLENFKKIATPNDLYHLQQEWDWNGWSDHVWPLPLGSPYRQLGSATTQLDAGLMPGETKHLPTGSIGLCHAPKKMGIPSGND